MLFFLIFAITALFAGDGPKPYEMEVLQKEGVPFAHIYKVRADDNLNVRDTVRSIIDKTTNQRPFALFYEASLRAKGFEQGEALVRLVQSRSKITFCDLEQARDALEECDVLGLSLSAIALTSQYGKKAQYTSCLALDISCESAPEFNGVLTYIHYHKAIFDAVHDPFIDNIPSSQFNVFFESAIAMLRLTRLENNLEKYATGLGDVLQPGSTFVQNLQNYTEAGKKQSIWKRSLADGAVVEYRDGLLQLFSNSLPRKKRFFAFMPSCQQSTRWQSELKEVLEHQGFQWVDYRSCVGQPVCLIGCQELAISGTAMQKDFVADFHKSALQQILCSIEYKRKAEHFVIMDSYADTDDLQRILLMLGPGSVSFYRTDVSGLHCGLPQTVECKSLTPQAMGDALREFLCYIRGNRLTQYVSLRAADYANDACFQPRRGDPARQDVSWTQVLDETLLKVTHKDNLEFGLKMMLRKTMLLGCVQIHRISVIIESEAECSAEVRGAFKELGQDRAKLLVIDGLDGLDLNAFRVVRDYLESGAKACKADVLALNHICIVLGRKDFGDNEKYVTGTLEDSRRYPVTFKNVGVKQETVEGFAIDLVENLPQWKKDSFSGPAALDMIKSGLADFNMPFGGKKIGIQEDPLAQL